MESSFLTQVLLPGVLALIMFGMGLSLTKDDFTRLLRVPKPIFVGLVGQIFIMPFIAFVIAYGFSLEPALAIGLMILAACPGGTTSNIISHLARANLALSVSLTAISTLICVVSTPFIIKFSMGQFGEGINTDFSLTNTILGLIIISLLPVLLGLWGRHKYPNAAMRREQFFRRFSGLFMLVMIIAILIQERATLASSFQQVFWATLALNLASILVGVILSKIFGLSARDTITLGIEVGIQNASMAMLIAVTFLQSPELATSAGVYGLTMYIGAAILVIAARRFTF